MPRRAKSRRPTRRGAAPRTRTSRRAAQAGSCRRCRPPPAAPRAPTSRDCRPCTHDALRYHPRAMPVVLPETPILATLPTLRAALVAHRNVVLEAPPGAGKSTVVPLALLDEPWLGGRSLLMLQPRRIAARAVARRLAQLA